MSYKRTAPAGLISVGFQTITLLNSTALGVNSTVGKASVLHLSVETQNVRYRSDAVDPALTTGVLLVKDHDYWLEGIRPTGLKFQRSTGTCKVSVQGYRRPGEPS